MQAKLSAIEEQAYQLAGHPFSLTSTEDISQVRVFIDRNSNVFKFDSLFTLPDPDSDSDADSGFKPNG